VYLVKYRKPLKIDMLRVRPWGLSSTYMTHGISDRPSVTEWAPGSLSRQL